MNVITACPSQLVKISPCVSQKRLRFGDNVGKREFIKFAKKYNQQLEEEECASVGRITVRAMSPPCLADIGVLLREVLTWTGYPGFLCSKDV